MKKSYKGYIGTYSKGEKGGLFRFAFDGENLNAEAACGIENPSFLCFCEGGLLAVSETDSFGGKNGGSLAYIRIKGDGGLELAQQVPTLGKSPCYVAEEKGRVFAANYSEGTASVFSLKNGKLSECEKVIAHSGKGADPNRQKSAHIHCTVVTPDHKFVAVCDLGIDRVVIYDLNGEKVSEIGLPAGAGPRHIIFHGGYAYVVTELSSEVFVYAYGEGRLEYLDSCKLLPEDFHDFSNAAAIKGSPCGRFITASNRGHNSLTTFKIGEGGRLELLCRTPCGGDFPRDFAYTPDGRHILCANQYSGDVTVLSADERGRTEYTGKKFSVPAPVCVIF